MRLAFLLLAALLTGSVALAPSPSDPSVPELSEEAEAWVEKQMATLSLREKVSQLFVIWMSGFYQSEDAPSYRKMEELVSEFGLGGVIFGRGDPLAQGALANDLQASAALPLLIAQDMEWGPGMRLDRATTLPRAMALGASRDRELARRAGYVTAREARAIGVHQLYAPVADVNNNPANPIINVRSFGERPELVSEMVAAFTEGAQRGGALATAKHFPGHGDTSVDSHLDLPVLPFERSRLDSLELVPFRAAVEAGTMSIMTGHLAFPALEPDSTVPASLSPNVTGDLLRGDLRYRGLVVTDALDMQGVTDHFPPGEAAVRALEAGNDLLLMSTDPHAARTAVLEAIEEGRLTEERIDTSLRRLLRAKAWLDLHRQRYIDLENVRGIVATRPHEVLSGTIARASLTLLRNEDALLPVTPPDRPRILSVSLSNGSELAGGPFHQRLRRAASGLEVSTYQLHTRSPQIDFDAVLQEAEAYDLVVVPVFVRVRAWSGDIGLPERHQQLLEELIARDTPVVLVSFGNPYVAGGLPDQPAAYLAAYGASEASQFAAAQALFGRSAMPGRLPVSIPGAYAYGEGLPHEQVAPRLDVPEAAGLSSRLTERIGSLLQEGIENRAFPGASVAVGRGDVLTMLDGYGRFTYDAREPITPRSVFDTASLTKVVVPTTAAMLLYEAGQLDLDAPVVEYLPEFGQQGKEEVTIRQLLSHSSGLQPYLGPEERGETREELIQNILAQELQFEPGSQSEYSGLGIITLSLIIEELTGRDLAQYAEEEIFRPLGMWNTGYRPVGEIDSTIVPTMGGEEPIQGAVHDPIARLMGGTSGNAGMFSTAEDLATFASMLVNEGRIYGQQFLKPETIELFTRRAGIEGSTRALGWDTKSDEGYSSAGEHFGPNSFGHTGYTGTSIWIDPDEDLYVILLTNRTYPDDTDRQIGQIRPSLADIVHEALLGPPEPLLPGPGDEQ